MIIKKAKVNKTPPLRAEYVFDYSVAHSNRFAPKLASNNALRRPINAMLKTVER